MTDSASNTIHNVSRRFGQGTDPVIALDTVSVKILENEFVTPQGPSGCGKTSLLYSAIWTAEVTR